MKIESELLDSMSASHERRLLIMALPNEALDLYVEKLCDRMKSKAEDIAEYAIDPQAKALAEQAAEWYKVMKYYLTLAIHEQERRSKIK